jgi:predicted nucleic acid-binding protein
MIDAVKLLGEAWDEYTGGKILDLILTDIIIDKFDKLPQRQGKPSLRELENKKTLRRILRRAEEIKEKLTAAKFMKVYIDNAADYVDINVNLV